MLRFLRDSNARLSRVLDINRYWRVERLDLSVLRQRLALSYESSGGTYGRSRRRSRRPRTGRTVFRSSPRPAPSSSRRMPASASSFHCRKRARSCLLSSLSTSLAHVWQSQIPFSKSHLALGASRESYRGPPGDAAVMCAATPILTALSGRSCGPLVGFRQSGFEHLTPARLASNSLTDFVKSSLRLGTTHRLPQALPRWALQEVQRVSAENAVSQGSFTKAGC